MVKQMTNRLTSILLAIALIGSIFLYFSKPSGHDQEIQRLERENKKISNRLDSAYQVIRLSNQREIALKLRSGLQDERIKELTQEANKNLKLYLNEKKRKTGILTDSLYTATIDSLYARQP